MLGTKAAVLRIVNHRAHDVGGQHVRRKLDTLEAEVDAAGKGFERKRFCQAWHAFEQDVPAGNEGNEQAVDQMLLADNHAPHLLLQWTHPRRSLLHRVMHRLDGRVGPGVRRSWSGHWCRRGSNAGPWGGSVSDVVEVSIIDGWRRSGQRGDGGIAVLNWRIPLLVLHKL